MNYDFLTREQTAQTRRLIDSEPKVFTLMRRPKVERTAAGGSRKQGDPEPAGDIRVFFGAKMRDGLPLQDNSGERVIQYYTIVADPGTDIQEGDTFTWLGKDYKVTFVHTDLPYEVKADVETVSGGYA